MISAYEEIVDFIAAGTTLRTVAHFEPSQETKNRVADLIHREKTTGLAPEEASELEHYLTSTINGLFQKQLTGKELAAVLEGLQAQGYIKVNETKITYALPASEA